MFCKREKKKERINAGRELFLLGLFEKTTRHLCVGNVDNMMEYVMKKVGVSFKLEDHFSLLN
jgi:hypothetical protein